MTGDTKVVGRGAADGLFIHTTSLGRRLPGAAPSADFARPGDAVVLSGPIGLHGAIVLSTREGLGFEADIASDSQPLHRLVRAKVEAVGPALRDPTRGGLASAVNELAQASAVGVELDETALPVPPAVAAACDMLGLDPLNVANEGCLVAFVVADRADRLPAAMRSVPEGTGAVRVGTVLESNPGQATVRTLLGARRVVDMLIGEQLPRIC